MQLLSGVVPARENPLNYWKEGLKISKAAKSESDLLKTIQETGPQSHRYITRTCHDWHEIFAVFSVTRR